MQLTTRLVIVAGAAVLDNLSHVKNNVVFQWHREFCLPNIRANKIKSSTSNPLNGPIKCHMITRSKLLFLHGSSAIVTINMGYFKYVRLSYH